MSQNGVTSPLNAFDYRQLLREDTINTVPCFSRRQATSLWLPVTVEQHRMRPRLPAQLGSRRPDLVTPLLLDPNCVTC